MAALNRLQWRLVGGGLGGTDMETPDWMPCGLTCASVRRQPPTRVSSGGSIHSSRTNYLSNGTSWRPTCS